ncbi:MAG: LysE family translocator [Rubrivivax sp.]|nr:MAG: LysE family translocator [Rubrivivax sp.]
MQQFLWVAAAHFLALVSPGPDFFLIARTAMAAGWRGATGACLGIAVANGIFIAIAFAGLGVLQPDSAGFALVQAAGCAYLLYLGVSFLRHAGGQTLSTAGPAAGQASGWWRGAGMGLACGLLNPKNALFYATLATLLRSQGAEPGMLAAYGLWMFSVVLIWDVAMAAAIGHPVILRRFSRLLPTLERACGGVLIVLAGVMAWHAFA